MCFKCDKCGTVKPDGARPVRTVVETRPKTYPMQTRGRTVIGRAGVGNEIVREEDHCSPCALKAKFAKEEAV